ncbi:3-oxoacyl-ACP reductase [Variovorax sp. WS11]|uniref:SDR family NAD(P)-dependent oxidoreductase n=1 Tax=Variovorax sp. WS11 TaxID=1105204 RepID=UPI000D0D4DF6|nr:SDR family oxidoreductase [Variovorax sp. WS11]NDZ17580.1 SDR family oxidoreductase [Variovorax sp. WS11]PSL82215.1 3-oxoacyl-ACP reductase [Variovorax sp. WS11]
MRLNGKVVIVTGAARGIGQEYAVAAAREGAAVVAADMSDCGQTASLVEAAAGRVIAVKVDVASATSAADMARHAMSAFGRIDGLVNNAALYGQLKGGAFTGIDEQEWDAAMAVNVKGIWNCCKAAVPFMKEQAAGSVVNITSLAATFGMPFRLHYTTSKAAVIGLTRGLARELGRDGIRVNAVAPAAVLTEGTQEFFAGKMEKALDAIKNSQAIPRNLVPADLAGTVIYLLSADSAFVTGQTLSVDGGTVMH